MEDKLSDIYEKYWRIQYPNGELKSPMPLTERERFILDNTIIQLTTTIPITPDNKDDFKV